VGLLFPVVGLAAGALGFIFLAITPPCHAFSVSISSHHLQDLRGQDSTGRIFEQGASILLMSYERIPVFSVGSYGEGQVDAASAALLGALLGAVVGASGSVATMWIQQHYQARQGRLRLGAEIGLAEFNSQVEFAKRAGKTVCFPPVSAYVLYHAEFLDALAAGKITPEIIQRLHAKQEQLKEHYPDELKARET
jgi:hypothetical protein